MHAQSVRRNAWGALLRVLPALLLLALAGAPRSASGQSPEFSAELDGLQEAIGRGRARWTAGRTPLTGLTPEQMRGYLGALETPREIRASMKRFSAQAAPAALPPAFDWRNRSGGNFVTAVRNQGGCGSCWAFAATAALEARGLIDFGRPGEPFDLSEQTLVSCGGAGSCGGGYLGKAADFLRSTGLPPESCQPYLASNASCSTACAGRLENSFRLESYLAVTQSLADLKQALVQHGPLPVGMSVYSDFQSYRSGIYSRVSGGYLGGHAVTIVGYDDAASCFIVKNSWGEEWGEKGFFRIAYAEVAGSSRFGREALAYGPVIAPAAPGLLGEAVDNSALAWRTGLAGGWFRQSAVSLHGGDAAQSGKAGWYEDSWIETTVAGPADVAFTELVARDASGGSLYFLVDDEIVHRLDYGTAGWQHLTMRLGAGPQKIRWSSSGWSEPPSDAWLDRVVVGPPSEEVTTPVAPTGPATSGTVGGLYRFEAAGSASDRGDLVQYRFDWGDGTKSSWSSESAALHVWNLPGTYPVRAQARCATHRSLRTPWSPPLAVAISPPPPIPLAEAVDAPALVFETGGDAPWFAQSGQTHGGAAAAQSGQAKDEYGRCTSWIRTKVSGPGGVRFSWRISGSWGAKLTATVSGGYGREISEERPWEQQTLTLGPGENTITWTYTQGADDAATSNAAWLDEVEFLPTYEALAALQPSSGREDGTVGFSYEYVVGPVTSSQGHPVEYRFLWGDGTASPWSADARATHAWDAPGSYSVGAEARCAAHHDLVAAVDDRDALSVSIAAVETIPTPAIPMGPSELWRTFVALYATGETTPQSYLEREYRFDWGDGTLSNWIYSSGSSVRTWHRWTDIGTYLVRAQSRCDRHPEMESPWSEALTVTVPEIQVVDLGEALDAPALVWTTGGDAPWYGQSVDAYAGGSSARSGMVGAGQLSWLQAAVSGPARVSFSHRVSSEYDDKLTFLVDGVATAFPYGIGGEDPWQVTVVSLAAGAHTLRWEYRKDAADTASQDCAWVDEIVVSPSSETVTAPGYPSGPYSAYVGAEATYTLAAVASSLGHALEYRFDWGDGSFSPWSAAPSASHAWSAAGSYRVRSQARCAQDTAVVSPWSSNWTSVRIDLPPETVTTPAAPTGPTEVVDGVSATYTAGTASTSTGDPVEYSFSWCDGSYSPWSPSPTATHVWSLPRACAVKAMARCATHTSVHSAWSAGLDVTITPSETISTPAVSGPTEAVTDEALSFTAVGAVSSLGHPLSYLFWWDDGSTPGYTFSTSGEASHAWRFPRTSNVKVSARCTLHGHTSAYSAVFPVVISWPPETVVAPPPQGPAQVWAGRTASFSAAGASTSLGHSVEYRYDWGDGTGNYWSGKPDASHLWAAAGTYAVRVQARCTRHYGTESPWSDQLSVTVADPPETISTPTKPMGPGYEVYVGDTVAYSSGGSVSSLGHPLEYRFCFDKNACTVWSDLPLVSHVWNSASVFSLTVSAQARCAAHPGMESEWSEELRTVPLAEPMTALGAPSGPAAVFTGATVEFVAVDADPALGHGREFSFDWGDGTTSGWLPGSSRTHAWPAPGSYSVRVRQRCRAHPAVVSSWSQPFTVVAGAPNDLAAALDAPALEIERGGDADWFSQGAESVAGGTAARSGAIGDHQFSWMRTSVAGPGSLSFSWKVSSQAADTLVLYLDGKEVSRISGSVDWAAKSVPLTAGRHTLLWMYRKDAAGFVDADCGWVDQVRLTTAAETVTAPGAPSGPGEGLTESPYAYEALGARSDKGHELEYRFDWGDGALSPWSSSPLGEHVWEGAGTYRVVAQVRCRAEHANISAFSPPTEVSIRALVENVAAPLVPSGSSAAFAGVAASFATGGGESDLGHPLQYRFDWGDGSRSAWSVDPGREHVWPSSGVFEVRAQARCATHAAKESGWSEAFLVVVSLPPEAVVAPLRPVGPAGAKTGSVVRFALGGGASNRGHAVEYRVDWGDGAMSDWGAGMSVAHAWSTAGSYAVAAQARCAEDPDVESPWSPVVEVAVSDHHDLAEALDNTALEWETGGDAIWTPLALASAAGGDSARSGRLAAYRSSWVETTVEGPTSLYFLWRVASEAGRDRLVFSLDGVEQRRIAGTTPWLFGSARVEEGSHRLQWRFTRGSRLTAVPHHAWLDLVVDDPREIAGSIEVHNPAGGESWARGRTVTLRWSSAGAIGPAVALQLLRRTPYGAWTARTLAPAVPDTGSWSWKIPAFLVPGARYRVRVVSCAGPAIRGISQGSFTVK